MKAHKAKKKFLVLFDWPIISNHNFGHEDIQFRYAQNIGTKTATKVPSIDNNVKPAELVRPVVRRAATLPGWSERVCMRQDPPMALSQTGYILIRGEQIIQYSNIILILEVEY